MTGEDPTRASRTPHRRITTTTAATAPAETANALAVAAATAPTAGAAAPATTAQLLRSKVYRCLTTATAAVAAALRSEELPDGDHSQPAFDLCDYQRDHELFETLHNKLRHGVTGPDAFKDFLQGVAGHFDGGMQS
ncbi:unnamed protein product [Ectocarpus sp. 12 AP-2014]